MIDCHVYDPSISPKISAINLVKSWSFDEFLIANSALLYPTSILVEVMKYIWIMMIKTCIYEQQSFCSQSHSDFDNFKAGSVYRLFNQEFFKILPF